MTHKKFVAKKLFIIYTDIREILKHMLEYFIPEDKEDCDTDNHKLARIPSKEPVNTADDKDFIL